MNGKSVKSKSAWVDPDDAPPWTPEMFERAEIAHNGIVIQPATGTITRRGRPRSADRKIQVSVRLKPDVLAALKSTGDGWQGVMNEILERWAKRQMKVAAGDAPRTVASSRKHGA